MELYIEKEFMDNFYLEYDEAHPSQGQRVVASIFKEYGEIDWFIDVKIDDLETLEELKLNNPFFAYRATYVPPTPVRSIKEHFLEYSNCQQTLIFTEKEENWHKQAEKKGAICFSTKTFQQKINKIIETSHFKVDLSEDFKNWDVFSALNEIPFNEILVNDNYILTNKSQQLMDKNVIPFFKLLLENKKGQDINCHIFTKDLAPKAPKGDDQIWEAVEKRYTKLNSGLANFKKKIKIVNNSIQTDHYDLHDRVLITNFFSIDSGKGFNLIPHKRSNSQIVVETIFDKYTYNRIRKHRKIYTEYLQRFKQRQSLKFTIYPN